MKRSNKRIRWAVQGAVAAACLLFSGFASAQSVSSGEARMRAAYAEWRKLSQTEVDCVMQALRSQRSSLQTVIQRGIGPNDSSVAAVRASCRAQARTASAPKPTPNATQALASVDAEATRQAADRHAAEKAAEKALAEKVAAEIAAVKKAAAAKVEAERIAAERLAAERQAQQMAAEERLAAEKAAAERAAEEKAAAERIAAEKIEAQKVAATKVAADKAPEQAVAPRKPQAEKFAWVHAKTEPTKTEPTKLEPTKPEARAEIERPADEAAHTAVHQPAHHDDRTRHDAARLLAEAANAYAAAELRNSFLYGLFSGPIIFCLGGLVFMMIGRRRSPAVEHEPRPR